MPVTISPIRLRYLLVVVAFVAFVSAMLLRTAIVQAEDAGAARAAAELAAAVDAGAPPIVDAGTAAAPAPPLPADPAAAPGDALDGFRLWWRTGWVYAVLFGIGSQVLVLDAPEPLQSVNSVTVRELVNDDTAPAEDATRSAAAAKRAMRLICRSVAGAASPP